MPVSRTQQIIAVLWPSFLLAAVATAVFFATFDPEEILAPTWFPHLSRLGAYSVGFLLFWALAALSSLLTIYFLRPVAGPAPPDQAGHG